MIGEIGDLGQNLLFQEICRRAQEDKEPLARQYCGMIESSFDSLHNYLHEIRRYFYHFTDHSITHSIRILNRISSFLSPEQISKLTTAELYLLISSALIHDIGMVVSEADVEHFLKSDIFKKQYASVLEQNDICLSGELDADWLSLGVGRSLIADYFRSQHASRSRMVMKKDIQPVMLLCGKDKKRADLLGKIAEAHSMDFSFVANEDNFSTNVLIDECRVNTRFIAICLRLGDLLDIDSSRICPMILQLSEPLPYLSLQHWNKYSHVELQNLQYASDIVISGQCPSQESHRLLKEWLRLLSHEISCVLPLLNTSIIRDTKQQYYLPFGRIIDSVEPEKNADGIPEYEFLEYRFNLDEERVFERLFGERLYGQTGLAIREVIQNAVDATRHRIAVDLEKNYHQSPGASHRELTPRQLAKAIDERKADHALNISLINRQSSRGNKEQTLLIIEDRGIGMSRIVIRDYLLKVGRSRWSEDPLLKNCKVDKIGEFGIGFLSTFMIADKIVIDTKSALPNESAIKATIHSWQSYIATEPSTKEIIGTRIELQLKEASISTIRDNIEMLDSLCPFVELPMIISFPDGSTKTIPARSLCSVKKVTNNSDRIFFALDTSSRNSLGSLARHPDGFAGDHHLCQDGLAVPGVAGPSRKKNLLLLALDDFDVRVDLRGADRFPLDLSRNLIRGDSKKIWNKLSSLIFRSLLRSKMLRHAIAQEFICHYSNLEYLTFFNHGRLLINRKGTLKRISSLKDHLEPSIGFVSCRGKLFTEMVADRTHFWVLVPDYDMSLDLADMEIGLADSHFIRRIRKINGLDHLNSLSLDRMIEDADDIYYGTLATIDQRVQYIFSYALTNYAYICPWHNGLSSVLSTEKSEHAIMMNDIGMIFFDGWLCVRSPDTSTWIYLPSDQFEEMYRHAISNALSWSDFLAFILLTIRSKGQSWQSKWWLSHCSVLTDLENKIFKNLCNLLPVVEDTDIHECRSCKQEDYDDYEVGGDSGDDEDYYEVGGDSGDDEDYYEVGGDSGDDEGEDEDEEERRHLAFFENRHRAVQKVQGRKEFDWFISDVLPGLDLSALENIATPWDKERYENRTLFQ